MLIVTSADGCTDTTFVQMAGVIDGLVTPNVFSPNGDGFNDEFALQSSGISEYSINIYDRWGVKIFETTAPKINWNGKTLAGTDAANGTYYYVLIAKAVTSGKDYSRNGFFTLVR